LASLTDLSFLEEPDLQKLLADFSNVRRTFLPIDAYDPLLDEENPHALINSYRDPATGLTLGLSKWFFSGPSFDSEQNALGYEMRKCEVVRYIDSEELYEMRWLCNGQYKKVVRFNLVFVREDQEAFLRRMSEAERMRAQADLMMKYLFLIEKTKVPKFELRDIRKTRISFMIQSYRPSLKDRKFRNPVLFLELPPGERYVIPES
jgi:hypothetical protein